MPTVSFTRALARFLLAPFATVEAATVGELVRTMSERYGQEFDRLLGAGSVVINGDRIAPGDATASTRVFAETDEVALLPPVSGGG